MPLTGPAPVARASYQAVREQAVGYRFTISFPDAVHELSPTQAASRQLPGGRHRKIARADVDAYQAKKATRRRLIAEAMNEVVTAGDYLPE